MKMTWTSGPAVAHNASRRNRLSHHQEVSMFRSLAFTMVGIIAAWLGFSTVVTSIMIAKVVFFVFYSGFLVFLIFEVASRHRRPSS